MDFSRFIVVLDEQKKSFDEVQKNMDAKGYDAICEKLNSTLSDISLVASVVPVESKKELINILKSMRELAVGLLDLRQKFGGPEETVEQEVYTEEVPTEPAPMESIEPTPIEPVDNVVPFAPEGNAQSQSEGQELSKGNVKSLTLTNPAVPNGNVFNQFNQAA